MPSATPTLVQAALRDRLVATLPPSRSALVDDKGRAESLGDNIISSLSPEQVESLRAQLDRGDGGELEFRDGNRPAAHSAHSSAMLAFNAFGAWLGREPDLRLDGTGGFSEPLRIEAKQRIFHGGRAPNLDCLIEGPSVVTGIESKLTEPLPRHSAKAWSDAYRRQECRDLLCDGWRHTLDAALDANYAPQHLDAAQLLKHALGRRKQNRDRQTHLLYVYWEPGNGKDFDNIRSHHLEVLDLVARVGDAEPHLHTMTYDQLWAEWDSLNIGWLSNHVAQLRRRYTLTLPS